MITCLLILKLIAKYWEKDLYRVNNNSIISIFAAFWYKVFVCRLKKIQSIGIHLEWKLFETEKIYRWKICLDFNDGGPAASLSTYLSNPAATRLSLHPATYKFISLSNTPVWSVRLHTWGPRVRASIYAAKQIHRLGYAINVAAATPCPGLYGWQLGVSLSPRGRPPVRERNVALK